MTVPVTGLVLASKRPENRIGWLFVLAGVALGLSGFSDQYALRALVADRGSLPAGQVFGWLKDAVDLDSVRDDLATVVQQALEPAHVSVWISQRD